MEQSAFGRIFSVLISPTKTFQAIAVRPTWGVVLIVTVVIASLNGFLVSQKMDIGQMIRQQMEERGGVSEAQIEQSVVMAEKFKSVGVIFGVGAAIGGSFLIGLLFWVGFKMMGSEFDFPRAMSTSVHGMVPNFVSGLLAIPVILSRETIDAEAAQQGNILASNLGFLAPENSKTLATLLSSIDVFSIWSLILLALGFQITAKVGKGASWGVVLALWAVWILIKLGLAALR